MGRWHTLQWTLCLLFTQPTYLFDSERSLKHQVVNKTTKEKHCFGKLASKTEKRPWHLLDWCWLIRICHVSQWPAFVTSPMFLLHMSSVAWTISECCSTKFAHKWFFTSVSSHVWVQAVLLWKGWSALCALIWFLSSVCSHVNAKTWAYCKAFTAHITVEWFFSSVPSHVNV